MTGYDIYVLLLCLIVFVMLAGLSVFCVYTVVRLSLKLIRCGVEDERLVAEYRQKQQNSKKNKYIKIAESVFSVVICAIFVLAFMGSLFVKCSQEDTARIEISSFRVVRTGSMAKKNDKNNYLVENKLDDQIQTFDLIRTDKLPDEFELELYDIVVYEVDGILLVHRIVEIEEPNEAHPDCRYFKLQGDAVEAPDRFPVLYEQMRAIYNGFRVPFVGSFIVFMQSVAGWLCMLFIIGAMIAMPIVERQMEKATNERLRIHIPDFDSAEGEKSEDGKK